MRPLVAHLAAAALVLGAATAWSTEKDDLRELRQRLERLRQDLHRNEDARAEASDQLRESETAISAANRALRELAARQTEVRTELERIERDTRALQADLDSRHGQLASLLHARYTGGEQAFAKLLLSGDDPNRTARQLTYHAYVSRAQLEAIRRVRDDLARLTGLEQDARERNEELAKLEEQQRTERQAQVAQAAERRKVLNRMAAQIRDQQREIQTGQRNEARLARLVDELAKALRARPAPPRRAAPTAPSAPSTPSSPSAPTVQNERVPDAAVAGLEFPSLKGRLRLPVRGELAGRFGTPRQDGGLSSKGVFIRAREGEEVRAVATGQVVFADWMRGFGNLLILDHGGGYMTIYGNNESVLKRLGDTVHAGEAVATVGASGGIEAPGLYFEMRHQGKAFDPMPWVSFK